MKGKMIKAKAQKGFTLIELMIAVAIVGILTTIAVPAFLNYTIRAQVTEGMSLAEGAKANVVEYYANKGEVPTSNEDAGYAGATAKFVSGVEIGDGGKIVATFGGDDVNSKLSGATLTLEPEQTDSGTLVWKCYSTADAKYVPSTCRDEPGTTTPPADPA